MRSGMDNRGITILEIMAAICILGVTFTALMQGLLVADKVSGRRAAMGYATLLASNCAEQLRGLDNALVPPPDTVMEAQVNGIAFVVSRRALVPAAADAAGHFREYAIAVARKNQGDTLVRFRLLQGFADEKAGSGN